MTVICIKEHINITLNKQYNISDNHNGDVVAIINDIGKQSLYCISGDYFKSLDEYFTPLEEFRNNQIDKLI